MNRRNFLNSILLAGASFSILPGAGRLWKARREVPIFERFWINKGSWEVVNESVVDFESRFVVDPEWRNSHYEFHVICGEESYEFLFKG